MIENIRTDLIGAAIMFAACLLSLQSIDRPFMSAPADWSVFLALLAGFIGFTVSGLAGTVALSSGFYPVWARPAVAAALALAVALGLIAIASKVFV